MVSGRGAYVQTHRARDQASAEQNVRRAGAEPALGADVQGIRVYEHVSAAR
jgi:hypothetical protein